MQHWRYRFIAFWAGGAIMVLELLATRILAPYLGLSLYVWTSVIGVILAALSAGYATGGILADRAATPKTLRRIILSAAITILGIVFLKDFLPAAASFLGPLIGSLVASVVLFVPASFLLASISPLLVKFELQTLGETGRTAGSLSALATLGSIAGTFLAGFVLIPSFGVGAIILSLAISLALLPLLVSEKKVLPSTIIIVLCLVGYGFDHAIAARLSHTIRIPSAYAPLTIVDTTLDNRPARLLLKDNELQSGIYRDGDDLAFAYTRFFRLDDAYAPHAKHALLLGGGAYTVAHDFLNRTPNGTIDVVEIDPAVTAAARTYFGLADRPDLRVTHQDGRVFLNQQADGKYDVIYNDSFSSHYAIPFQLATQEAVRRMDAHLAKDGVVIVNLISSIEGVQSQFLRAEVATFQSVFPSVRIFAVTDHANPTLVQNMILVASNSPLDNLAETADVPEGWQRHEVELEPLDAPILTDDFAPTDYYAAKLQQFLSL